MNEIIKFPGAGLAVRASKKQGTALITATLDGLHHPLRIASECRDAFRYNELKHLNDNNDLSRWQLSSAKSNHERMLPRAGLVRAARAALWRILLPPTQTITRIDAIMMLMVLFGTLGKKKDADTTTLLAACVEMLDPDSDSIGEATGLWRPVSPHPVVVALAIKRLINTAVFTSPSELRDAMHESRRTLVNLEQYTDRWMALLHKADRIVFEHDRAAWLEAYADVGADVVTTMMDSDESADVDDNGDDIPASPRWVALEAMRRAKLIE
jgi:hypothetical protein